MTKMIIRTDTVDGFFGRAKKAAQKSDQGELFERSTSISFETSKQILITLFEFSRPIKHME